MNWFQRLITRMVSGPSAREMPAESDLWRKVAIVKRWLFAFCLATFGGHWGTLAGSFLSAELLPSGGVRLSFPVQPAFTLERSGEFTAVEWTRVLDAAVMNGDRFQVDLLLGAEPVFFRLREGALTVLASTSPLPSETGVAVTRETVVHFTRPLSPETPLTLSQFYATFGSRQILSRVEVSGDRRSATLFYLEPLPGNARIQVTLVGTGIRDSLGWEIDPAGSGRPGSVGTLSFDTLNTTPLAGTAVVGRVYASELVPGPDTGTNAVNRPLAGVTITVDGMEQTLRAVTDAEGRFKLEPAPPGRFFVHIDGRTVRNLPANIRYPDLAYYPAVGKAWDAVAGRTNNLAGGTGDIFLPLIKPGTLQPVSLVQDTTIAFPAEVVAANPALAGVSITVPANSLFSDNGTRGGKVGIAPVPPDRLPGPLPEGLAMPMVITVQTDGPLNFDRPAPICFPNLPDPVLKVPLPAGSRQALISFNHDKGIWEAVGSMTVSADGKMICTDPGVGIRQPGWHGVGPIPAGPPPPLERPPGCKDDRAAENECVAACNAQIEPCIKLHVARYSTALSLCDVLCIPCETPEGVAKRAQCYSDAFRKLVRRRAECYAANVACIEWCIACWGLPPEPANRFALPAGGDPIEDRIVGLYAQMELLVLPFVTAGAPLPTGILEQVEELRLQAEAAAGGDAAAYLRAKVIEYEDAAAARFGVDLEDLNPGNAPGYPIHYAATILQPEGLLTLRGVTGPFGQYSLFVPRNGQLIDVAFFDPKGGRYALISTNLNPRARYVLPRFTLAPTGAGEPDSDGDGLADVVEEVMGTDVVLADTDGDGILDGIEVAQGGNPLDGFVALNGAVASTRTPGTAVDVWAGPGLIVTAEGAGGISVLNAYRGEAATILAHFDNLGSIQRVAGDGGLVAGAAGAGGLVILDLRSADRMELLQVVPGGQVNAVAAAAGRAYAGHGDGRLTAVDLASGRELSDLTLPAAIIDLAVSGDHLYALVANRLYSISIRQGTLELKGSVQVRANPTNRRLFAGDGFALVTHLEGYDALSLANPDLPSVAKAGNSAQRGWQHLVADGSGLGLAAVGPNSPAGDERSLGVYDIDPLGAGETFVTQFPTPGVAFAVAIHRGLAYVADRHAGLTVVNYGARDTAGIAPTVQLASSAPAEGVTERSQVRVTARVADDVRVSHVEFLVEGTAVAVDAGYPFELRFTAPDASPARTNITILARAFDTGGNVASSAPMILPLLSDRLAPTVVAAWPMAGGRVVQAVTVRFDEPMRSATLTPSSFQVIGAGADGLPGTADDVVVPGGSVQYQVIPPFATLRFPSPLAAGLYRIQVSAGVTDVAGNALAGFAWEFRVADAVFWATPRDGAWENPANWSEGLVPGAQDDVVIDVPSRNALVSVANGLIQVRSLSTHERIRLNGTDLRASAGVELHNVLTLSGGAIRNSTITQHEPASLAFAANGTHTLDNVRVNGDLAITSSQATVQIRNGLVLEGKATLDNGSLLDFIGTQTWDSSELVFGNGGGTLQHGTQLTLGPNLRVRGGEGAIRPFGTGRLINRGLIAAEGAGRTLFISGNSFENLGRMETRNGGSLRIMPSAWRNAGRIDAAGNGTLTFEGAWTNDSIVSLAGGTWKLGGTFGLPGLGSYQRTAGSMVVSGNLNLAGATLALGADTGPWTLEGGIIRNGTIVQTGPDRLRVSNFSGNTLDAVSVEGDLMLDVPTAFLRIRNGLSLAGTVQVSNGAVLEFDGNQAWNTGALRFAGTSGFLRYNGQLTLGPSILVHGRSGDLSAPVAAARLINRGTIAADVDGGECSSPGTDSRTWARWKPGMAAH